MLQSDQGHLISVKYCQTYNVSMQSLLECHNNSIFHDYFIGNIFHKFVLILPVFHFMFINFVIYHKYNRVLNAWKLEPFKYILNKSY